MCDSKPMETLRESLFANESIQESLTQIIHTQDSECQVNKLSSFNFFFSFGQERNKKRESVNV